MAYKCVNKKCGSFNKMIYDKVTTKIIDGDLVETSSFCKECSSKMEYISTNIGLPSNCTKKEVTTIRGVDNSIVEDVVLLHPELMKEESKEIIKQRYYELIELQKKLQDARKETSTLEKKYNTLKDAFRKKENNLYKLVFKPTEKECVTTNIRMRIINESDGRNM